MEVHSEDAESRDRGEHVLPLSRHHKRREHRRHSQAQEYGVRLMPSG